ncbi:unnamed protein product [Dibothriocephalus latus]|uniref:Mon2/Sec7/BIG1-like HUS domain-containing protein n=1 Tax=Dibothriocephalus latus TaxID=60516 RepID=A0A3P7LF41_DIBLA|nr:unnamed protein product [Dibothriocephalus latus]
MTHRIDPKTVRYFESRADVFLKKCSVDEREDFILNTFAEVNKEGWFVCTNAKICSSLEKLMPYASITAIGLILKAFSKDLDSVFNTKFAHHVLHAALKRCTYDLESVALCDPLDPSYSDRLTDLVNRLLLSNEFDTFVVDAITCPLLQCLLIVCSKRLEENFDSICSHILKKSVLLKPSEADTLAVSPEQTVR